MQAPAHTVRVCCTRARPLRAEGESKASRARGSVYGRVTPNPVTLYTEGAHLGFQHSWGNTHNIEHMAVLRRRLSADYSSASWEKFEMLCVVAASLLSFSPTSWATARHHRATGVCPAPSGRTCLLTSAASPRSEGHSNWRSPPAPALTNAAASANALSRRASLLSGAAFAAGLAAPPAAWAGSDAAKARAQMESSKAALDELLAQWDDVVAKDGGNGVRRVLGKLGPTSPLHRIDKAANLVARDLEDERAVDLVTDFLRQIDAP